MFCSRLLILQEIVSHENLVKINDYFYSLIGNEKNVITVSKLAKAIDISENLAAKVLIKCRDANILCEKYSIRCPNCGLLVKRIESLEEINDDCFQCYNCDEDFFVSPKDIELLYSLVEDGKSVFIDGQQNNTSCSTAISVAPSDTLHGVLLAGGVNEYFWHFDDSKQAYFMEFLKRVKLAKGTTKKIGDTLENMTKELFKCCSAFVVSNIRTTTNQIDGFIRNKMYVPYGVFNKIGSEFIIECKNESNTPKGEYLSKMHSILTVANAGEEGKKIKFGIIVSKKKGPSTFRTLAVKYYLSNKIVIISISINELEDLISKKGNLLEMIDRKIIEIETDSTTDLKECGLYSS